MNQDDAIRFIQSLSNKQLVEFMSLALQGRRADEGAESTCVQAHWCLAEASRLLSDQNAAWEDWQVHLLAAHKSQPYPEGWADDALICQLGDCEQCGYQLMSWAKKTVCPVCGADVLAS